VAHDADRPGAQAEPDTTADASAQAEAQAEHASFLDRLRHLGRAKVLTLVGFLIASLVVPAATKQWSDRSAELALKKELISQINATVTKAVAVTDCTTRIDTCFPEARALKDPNAGQEARAAAEVAYGRQLFETKTEWTAGQASIASVLDAYFPATAAHTEWTRHSDAVSAFMRLSSAECGAPRDRDSAHLQAYLPQTHPDVWTLLKTNIGPDCQLTSAEFELGYAVLAQDLLAQTPRVIRAVTESNAEGYSSGARDFLQDLWPL
jgi:hypothetical protein